MAGNVWEWCASRFQREIAIDAQQDVAIEAEVVLRGGSWRTLAANAGWDARRPGAPGVQTDDWGFRVCLKTLT